jgi:hypothetical protein
MRTPLYNLPDINLENFCNFCKNNIFLLLAITLALFFCYGIKLFQYSIGIDTELFLANKAEMLEWYMQIGRFGFVFLHRLLHINEFNPFTAFLSTFCLIWLFTVSWCYIIALFQRKMDKNYALIPFALIFITSPILGEQFYFTLQSTEVALMVLLCSYTIYIMFRGFIDNKASKIVFAFLSLIFMTSVYQAMVPFFCCGAFICFMLFLETSDCEPQIYRSICLKILAILIGAMIIYIVIDRLLISVFNIEKSLYLSDMNKWGQVPIKENFRRILSFIYNVTVKIRGIFGNILLLPITVIFIIKVVAIARKKITDNRFLYILAGVLIPLSSMFLAILGGNRPPIRAIYVLPLALSFMFFFLIKNLSKKLSVVVVILALFTAAYQAQITSQLFYSDQLRYNEDVRLAYEIRNAIAEINPEMNLPVAIIGKYKISEKFHANFLLGDVIGHSFFEWGGDVRETANRSLNFMRTLGIQFNSPSDELLKYATNEANSIPSYPDAGFIKKLPNVIVVKLSDFIY